MNEELYIVFENYLTNQLSEKDKIDFENQLQNDASIREKFRIYQNWTNYLENKFDSKTIDFKKNWKPFLNQTSQKTKNLKLKLSASNHIILLSLLQ